VRLCAVGCCYNMSVWYVVYAQLVHCVPNTTMAVYSIVTTRTVNAAAVPQRTWWAIRV
jgi:hypothetical protein